MNNSIMYYYFSKVAMGVTITSQISFNQNRKDINKLPNNQEVTIYIGDIPVS